MLETSIFCCGFVVLAFVAAVIFALVLGTGTRARQEREMLQLMRQQALAQGLPLPKERSSIANVFVVSILVVVALMSLIGYCEKGPPSPVPRQSVTPPPSNPTTGPGEKEGLIRDESPEYRKAAASAVRACSSISAEHIAILMNILTANKATGKTRVGSTRIARDWCREKSILDGDYERCISALSKTLWRESSVLTPTQGARPAKAPSAARVGSAPESSGNKFHDRLVGMTDAQRNQILWGAMQSGDRENRGECDSVVRNFFQGFDEDESRNATWNVACRNGRSFSITVYNDSAGSTKILDCAILKLVGVECFKKF